MFFLPGSEYHFCMARSEELFVLYFSKNKSIDIAYRDYGPKNAEPILLVQGLGGQLTFWPENLINFLKDA